MSFSLHQYGITLRRITEADIEIIRNHRNELHIRKAMRHQKKISKRKQRKWFESINNRFNYYFMIEIDNQQVGLINCKDVDAEKELGEGGIFIWNSSFINTPYPLVASVTLIDFIFNQIKIGTSSFVHVLASNKKAIEYNKFLGYKVNESRSSADVTVLELEKDTFNQKLPVLSKACSNFTNSNSEFKITGTPSRLNLDVINELIQAHQKNLD